MELPKVYANPIDREIDNVQSIFKEESNELTMDVRSYVDSLYKSGRIVYMIPFIINVNGVEFEDKIVSMSGGYLILKSSKRVKIGDIRYIKEIKK